MTIEEDIALIEELLEYKKLGTLEEVEEAVGKQTAEKPRKVLGINGNTEYECGYCGESEFINEGGIFSGEEKTEDALEIFSSIKAFSIKFISLKLPKTESEFSRRL